MNRKWIVLLLRIAIGAVFIYTGIIKTGNPEAFADSIATFRLLPEKLITIVALCLPVFEIILGLLLILSRFQRAAALGILLMSSLFTFALVQGMMRGLEIDCGCFGRGAASAWKTSLSLERDFVLIACSAFVYLSLAKQLPVKPSGSLRRN